jgi:hypothetical protein
MLDAGVGVLCEFEPGTGFTLTKITGFIFTNLISKLPNADLVECVPDSVTEAFQGREAKAD